MRHLSLLVVGLAYIGTASSAVAGTCAETERAFQADDVAALASLVKKGRWKRLRGEKAWAGAFKSSLRKEAEQERSMFGKLKGAAAGSDAHNRWCISNSALGHKLRHLTQGQGKEGHSQAGLAVWQSGAARECDVSMHNLALAYMSGDEDRVAEAVVLWRRAVRISRALDSTTVLAKHPPGESATMASIVSLRFTADQIEHLVEQQLLPPEAEQQYRQEVAHYRSVIDMIPDEPGAKK
jgi:hypothetical protein